MQCSEISMVCYVVVYVVKYMLELTVYIVLRYNYSIINLQSRIEPNYPITNVKNNSLIIWYGIFELRSVHYFFYIFQITLYKFLKIYSYDFKNDKMLC